MHGTIMTSSNTDPITNLGIENTVLKLFHIKIFEYKIKIIFYSTVKTSVFGAQKNRLICFG